MTRTPAEEKIPLSFAWIEGRRGTFVLPIFLLASLLAHTATFFLFQVTYPQQVTIPAPAPTVSVLDPARQDHQVILQWVAAADPALAAVSPTASPKGLLELPYKPSFSTPRTPLRFVPAESQAVRFPPAIDPLALIRGADRSPRISEPAPPPSVTRISLGGALAKRAPRNGFSLEAVIAGVPQDATFLIGVDAEGKTRFSFLQESSGHELLDFAAEKKLRQLQFQSSSDAMTWGMVTIHWGDNNLRMVKPQEAVEPVQP